MNTNTMTAPETSAIASRNKPSRLAAFLVALAIGLAGYLIYELFASGQETLRALDALIVYS